MSSKTSVVICGYNYARFLPPCLESVHSQSRPAEEIIVGDVDSMESLPLKICYSAKGSVRDKRTSKLLWRNARQDVSYNSKGFVQ